jgi:peptidoglycan/LPS O-acetylase OafA/YrhL
MSTYFPLLDLLRFLAAFGVMCYHYFLNPAADGNPLYFLINHGFIGVELFFIISGFVIFFSVTKSTKEYALGRFLRLYPLFWFCCTITYMATRIFPNGGPLPFSQYLLSFFIISDGTFIKPIDFAYWSLTEEILFYVSIGIFVHFWGEKKILYYFIGWLLLSVATFACGLERLTILKLFLTRFAPYFVFGGLLAYYYKNKATISKKTKCLVFTSMGIAAILPYYISTVLNKDPDSTKNFHFGDFDMPTNIVVFSLFIIVPLCIYFSDKITKKSFISTAKILGGITYPLYLLHLRIGDLIIGSSYGKITPVTVSTAAGMLVASYFISVKEKKWRRALMKRIMSSRFFNKPIKTQS